MISTLPETEGISHSARASKKKYLTSEYYLSKLLCLSIQHGWEFPDSDFPTQIPHFKLLSEHEVMLPIPYFKDTPQKKGPQRTLESLWKFTQHPTEANDSHCLGFNDCSAVKLVSGIDYKPGIRWVLLNLKAFEEASALELWDSADSCFLGNSEALVAAILLDNWFGPLDNNECCCVLLSGYACEDPETGELKALLLRSDNSTGRFYIEAVAPETKIQGIASISVNNW